MYNGNTVEACAGDWGLHKLGIEICQLNSPREAFADPQVVAREMVTDTDHPLAGPVHLVSSPFGHAGGTAETASVPAPAVGQDTEDVLRSLGYSDADIQRMKETGVV